MLNIGAKPVALSVVGLVGLSLGSLSGYYFAKSELKKKYDALYEKEVEEARVHYAKLYKRDEFSTPAAALGVEEPAQAQAMADILSEYTSEEVATSNIWDRAEPINGSELTAEEVANRNPEKPYLLTYDEYMEGELDYTQTSLTYFEGDDVLADDRDGVVPDQDGTVGIENLTRFGVGSKDSKIVYVRNDRLELDFEIVKSEGKYAKEVLGFIEHSEDHHRRPRRFGRDDE